MINNGFTTVSSENIRHLTGSQKAAILMGELGIYGSQEIIKLLSEKELAKLRKTMKYLGKPIIKEEANVLTEVNKIGVSRNLTTPVTTTTEEYKAMLNPKSKTIQDILKSDTDAIASVLKAWISEE